MAQFSSKHGKREQTFSIRSFHSGLNQEISPSYLPVSALTRCKNMKYSMDRTIDGQPIVVLKKRQGTEKISNTALASAMVAETYFLAGAQYIVATTSKVYYLDASYDPVEIGSISGRPTFTEFHEKLIIHDSGVTKAWDGTTFETLNGLYTDELLATGDGAITEFSGTIAHPAVQPGEFDIEYTDVTAKAIADDGNGRLTGDISAAVVKNITGASQANPCQITAVGHSFSTGDVINIQSVGGMTQLNNITFTITNTGANTFTLDGIDSTGYTAYTSGGTASGNAIKYSSGAYLFTCSGAPDNSTTVLATYEKVAGAPKSKAGFVRSSRLYTWGDSDNPSRLSYTAANDEDAWDSSSSGGYLDVDPLDGYSLISCANYFQSIVAIKGNSLHRINGYPGDATFVVQPLISDIGSVAYQTCTNDGKILSFLSKEGWIGLTATEEYGDISKTLDLSEKFRSNAVRYANQSAYSEYNQIDKQLWLTLYNGATQIEIIYVANLEMGGQISLYEFAFAHSSFKYVNGEMLIGGSDGHLYRLYNLDSRYKDNGVSYSADTYCRGVMTNWGLTINRKHNKKIMPHIYGKVGMTATLNIYKDGDYNTTTYSTSLTVPGGDTLIYDDGQDVLIYDMDDVPIGATRLTDIHKKFNYEDVMFEITNISGALGAEIYGIDFEGAILGD